VPKDKTVDQYLEALVWEGATERYGDPLPQEVTDRINHELGVVQRMGFQEYFLVVWDLVNYAKKEGIRVGYGRGSAAGSILSYCLRITNLDPIKFGLLFERFLVEGRKSMPDIDLDFDDRYRHRVIDYAKQRYGLDHVAHICTFNSIGAKQAIRDAARVLDYDYLTGDALAKLIPPPVLGKAKTLGQSLDESKELLDKYEHDPEAKVSTGSRECTPLVSSSHVAP
jgi:DNA polymerase-3 subunit alpha